jgi:hypothetical protein
MFVCLTPFRLDCPRTPLDFGKLCDKDLWDKQESCLFGAAAYNGIVVFAPSTTSRTTATGAVCGAYNTTGS